MAESRWPPISGGGGGSGDVVGPATSTANAVARYNGTSGVALKDSGVIIDDLNNVTGVSELTAQIIEGLAALLPPIGAKAVLDVLTQIEGMLAYASDEDRLYASNGTVLKGLVEGPASSTDNQLLRWDGTSGKTIQGSAIGVNDSGDMSGVNDLDMTGELDVAGNAVFSSNLTVAGNTVLNGNLEVQGTQSILNTDLLQVEDKLIEVNYGGTDASAAGAGISALGTGNIALANVLYDSALASKWKVGAAGSEKEIVDIDSAQTLSNKTVLIANGTVAAPGLAFGADADGSGTGLYRVSANTLGFAANGVKVGEYGSAGWMVYDNTAASGSTSPGFTLRHNTATAAGNGARFAWANASGTRLCSIRNSGTGGGGTVYGLTFETYNSGNVDAGSVSGPGAWTWGVNGSNLAHTAHGNITINIATAGADSDSLIVRNSAAASSGTDVAGIRFMYNNGLPAAIRTVLVSNVTGEGRLGFFVNDLSDITSTSGLKECGSVSSAGKWTFGKTNSSVIHLFQSNIGVGSQMVNVFKTTGADSASNYLMAFGTDTVTQGYIWNNAAGNLEILTASDIRLKENIRDADYGLAEIMKLRPVAFDWKSGSAKDVKGFIADEVENVLPRSVSVGADGYKFLGKDEFVPILVKAVQELSARVAALEARL